MPELEIGLVDGGETCWWWWSIFPAVQFKEKNIFEEVFEITFWLDWKYWILDTAILGS